MANVIRLVRSLLKGLGDIGLTWREILEIVSEVRDRYEDEHDDDGKVSPAEIVELVGDLCDAVGERAGEAWSEPLEAVAGLAWALAEQLGEDAAGDD